MSFCEQDREVFNHWTYFFLLRSSHARGDHQNEAPFNGTRECSAILWSPPCFMCGPRVFAAAPCTPSSIPSWWLFPGSLAEGGGLIPWGCLLESFNIWHCQPSWWANWRTEPCSWQKLMWSCSTAVFVFIAVFPHCPLYRRPGRLFSIQMPQQCWSSVGLYDAFPDLHLHDWGPILYFSWCYGATSGLMHSW